MHISWVVLQVWKPPTKWKMLTTWWPGASWSLRTHNVNPCDTILLPLHQPVRELCMSWSHTLRPPSLPGHFKNALPREFPGGAVVRVLNFHCLSLEGVWVQSLVRELRSWKPSGVAKRKKKKLCWILEHKPPISLYDAAINLSLLQTLMF